MLVELIITTIKIAVLIGVVFTVVAYTTFAERKVSAYIQDRIGPNRAGPKGLLQPLADGIKMFFKEDIIPLHVDKYLFVLAPGFIMTPALIAFAVVPFADPLTLGNYLLRFQIADLNVGVLYIIAIVSLGVYGIAIGGWASNNKYSLMGGLRSSAQMVSYEIPMGLALISIVMMAGSLRLNDIISGQTQSVWDWYFFRQPLAFLLFLVAAFAETNRLPFDLPEAEQELVAGYHTEYSAMKFVMFYMAEYTNMVTSAIMITSLFFGGFALLPGLDGFATSPLRIALLQILSFFLKIFFWLFFYIWVRWTLPRFRYDQLMKLGWKVLLPLGLANIIITAWVMAN